MNHPVILYEVAKARHQDMLNRAEAARLAAQVTKQTPPIRARIGLIDALAVALAAVTPISLRRAHTPAVNCAQAQVEPECC